MKQDYHCMVENWDEPSFGSIKTRGRNVTNPLNKEQFFLLLFLFVCFFNRCLNCKCNNTTCNSTQYSPHPTLHRLQTSHFHPLRKTNSHSTARNQPSVPVRRDWQTDLFFLMYISNIWLWYASNFAQDWILYTKLARLMLCVITEDFGRPICCFQVFKILRHQQPHYHDKKKREHCCSVISFLFEPIPCFTTLHQYHTPRTFSGVTWQA